MEDKEHIVEALLDNSINLLDYVGEHRPIESVAFLSNRNIGYFRMLSIAQDLLGVISDENKINSFLDEFKIEYTKLK